jgi:hypothetical protein
MNPKQEALEIVAPALSHAVLAASISRTIEQYKLFGLYSDEIDGFLETIVGNVEHILTELKDEL